MNDSTDAVSLRLSRISARTGLSPAQLGVARIYDRAHVAESDGTAPDAGPLCGLDVLVKDLNRLAGEVTTFGSSSHAVLAEDTDGGVQRLLDDGARLVGSSVSSEFGATVYTEPVDGPGPVNPVDRRMTTGGSSSGAAVAVARGVVDVAHASDGGGSIRVPAAAVGLPGLKPAHEVFPGFTDGRPDDAAPLPRPLPNPAAQGFICRDLDLTARAYDLPRTVNRHTPLRLGHTNEPFHTASHVDPTVANATAAAASLLVTHPGVEGVRPVPPPYPVEQFSVFSRIMAARCRGLPDPDTVMPAWLKEQGRALDTADILAAADAVAELPQVVTDAWGDCDVVVTPMLACAPPAVGAFSRHSAPVAAGGDGDPWRDFVTQTAWTPWATLWNLTGWAGLSVPLLADPPSGRWPVSVHLGAVADRVSPAELIDLASFLQDTVAAMTASDPTVPDAVSLPVASLPGDVDALLEPW